MPLPVFTTGPDSASTTVTDSVWDNTSGDGDWSTAGNWEDNAVPTSGNRVYLGNFTSTIDQGLGQSAINLDELNIGRDFRGELDGLTIDAGIVRINKPHGTLSLDGNYRNIYVEDTPARQPPRVEDRRDGHRGSRCYGRDDPSRGQARQLCRYGDPANGDD
jgi:hypothetical protein